MNSTQSLDTQSFERIIKFISKLLKMVVAYITKKKLMKKLNSHKLNRMKCSG
jgi:hypothetical protein